MDLADEMAGVWERECAVTALAGAQVCPTYRLPCWVCIVLHIMTGVLRNVTEGCFDRFRGVSILLFDEDRSVLSSRGLVCPHHPGASTIEYAQRHGPSYWHCAEPSLTSTPVMPAQEGEQWPISSEASFGSRSRGTARSAATGALMAPEGAG